MSLTPLSRGRARRAASVVAATSLGFAALVAGTSAAHAAGDLSATLTPTSASPSTNTTFHYTFTSTGTGVGAVDLTLPAGYGAPSSLSINGSEPWSASYETATRTFHLTASDNSHKVDVTESEAFTFQAVTPAASGSSAFAGQSWGNVSRSGGGSGTSSTTVTVGSVAQAITFNPPTTKTYGDGDFLVSATGGASGNPVTFTLGAGSSCTIADHANSTATVHITAAGSCAVKADQAAGGGYTAAPQVTRTITIAKASQTISLNGIDTQTYAPGATVPVVASASSGLSVALGVTGSCSIAGTTITLTGAGSCAVTANQAGNGNYLAPAPQQVTFSINKASAQVALNLSDLTATYNGTQHAVSASTTPDGLSGLTVTYDGSATPPTDAGSYDVVASLNNNNYSADNATGTLVIAPKAITGAFTLANKVYNGSADAGAPDCSLPSGVVAGDHVSVDCSSAVATFGSKDVGTRVATISGATLTGSDAGNYTLSMGTASAAITPATVTATIQAGDKTYDGNANATVIASLDGVIGSDDVTADVVSATFGDKNVGTGKTVTATLGLSGGDSGNYVLASSTVTDKATISALSVTASFTATNKEYDGTTSATIHPSIQGILGGDTVTIGGTGSFADKGVGSNKTVTSTDLALDGSDAGNYSIGDGPWTAQADITAKSVTASFTADNKVYDATTGASIHPSVAGILDGDTVTIAGTGGFGNKDVGNGKTVTSTDLALDGPDAGNYSIGDGPWTAQANITAKSVTASITADGKVYDANTSASIHPALTGVVDGDTVTVTGSGTFDNKNVGTGKTVTSTDLTLGGADGGNYALATGSWTATADITAKSVTGSITADNKVYNATTGASIHPTLTGVIGGDTVTVSGSGAFDNKNVGTGKTVTSTDLTLGGADGGNYTLAAGPWTATANITAKSVSATITADNKVWDGTTTATIHPTLTGVVSGDTVTASGSGTFANPSVGTWTVTSTNLGLGGADAANYTLAAGPWTTSAKITAAYAGTGFYQPVDMNGVYNKVKGGQTVPLKFNETDATGVNQTTLSIFAANAFSVSTVACSTSAPIDAVEMTTTGSTSLRYDTTAGQYIQNWKTPTAVGCYAVKVTTVDGSTLGPAYFQITK